MYKWGSRSLNDPCPLPLRFYTEEQANRHAESMNELIHTWENNTAGLWNKNYWKDKPLKWDVFPL